MKSLIRRGFASLVAVMLLGPLSGALSAAQLKVHVSYDCDPQGNAYYDPWCLEFDVQVSISPNGAVSAVIGSVHPKYSQAWISEELKPEIGAIKKLFNSVEVEFKVRISGYQRTYNYTQKTWVMDSKNPTDHTVPGSLKFPFDKFPELQNIQNFQGHNSPSNIPEANSPPEEPPVNPPQANLPLNPPQQEPLDCAILQSKQGMVRIKKANGPWVKAVEGIHIYSGDMIKTLSNGSVTLKLNGGSIVTVKPDSEFVIPEDPANTKEKVSVIRVMQGALFARAKKEENSLNVGTPNAICGVRGTEFEVNVIGDQTCVEVYEGMVWLRDLATNITVDIKAGSKSCVSGAPQPSEPVAGGAAVSSGSVTFLGTWQTTSDFGKLEINLAGLRVSGTYTHDNGKIEGTLSADGKTLTGTWSEAPSYKPPQDAGKFILKLADDGQSFSGRWWYGLTESAFSQVWNGERIK